MSTVIKGSGNGQINLNDTTGSIQLNGSDVLTIDSSGNLTAPNNLTVTGSITGNGSGLTSVGKILQVVQSTSTSSFTTTAGSFVDSGYSVTITPSSTSNKILIMFDNTWYTTANGVQGYVTLYRDATELSGQTNGFIGTYTAASTAMQPINLTYLDSPSTTSSVTYKIYIKSANCVLNYFTHKVTLTAMEVSG